jgi:signal transduction histidine kinase/CheY-like chemotaxis protein/ligand-binding sensor domain-containing protein
LRLRFACPRPAFLSVLAAIALSAPALASAQTLGRPSFQPVGGSGGIERTGIESLALDPGGELWIGSQDGAALYDGRDFREQRLPQRQLSNWVHAVLPAAGGLEIYFATDAGIARRRDLGSGQAAWDLLDAAGSGLPSNVVRALAEHRGELVAGTEKGLARLAVGRFLPLDAAGLPATLDVTRLAATPGGALWIGSDAGLGRIEGGGYFAEPLFAGRRVEALFADGRGLLAAVPGAVYRRDAGDAGWRPLVEDAAAFAGWPVSALARVGEPEQVFLGGDRGLRRLAGGRLETWGYAEGLPTGSIRTLLAAPGLDSDLLFIGSSSGGLFRSVLNGWNVLDARGAPLPRDDINAIGEVFDAATRAYFFGTETGLARFSGGRWDLFTTANSDLPSDNVNGVLQAADGEVYFATENGLLVTSAAEAAKGRLRGKAFLPASSPLPHAAVLTLLRAREGGVFVGTRGGLALRRPDGSWQAESALAEHQVYALAELAAGGETQLWAGTRRGGLFRRTGGTWQSFAPGNSPLPNPWVNCLEVVAAPDGRPLLWAGTDGGAIRLDPAAPEKIWLLYTEETQPALPNQMVYQIRRDSAGRLLFFTNRGLARTRSRTDESTLEVLTTADGLPANDFTSWGTMIDGGGRLWAGTSRGLAVFDAALFSRRLEPAKRPRWQKAEIENRRTAAGALPSLGAAGGPAYIEWNDRLLLRYHLPRLLGGEATTFETQLVGLEHEPASATVIGERLFSHLPSGRYRFRVRAKDARGELSLPLELDFEVKSAPWLSGWAIGVYLLAGGGLLVLALQRREARQRQSQAALEALVDERTASLRRSEAEARLAREEAEEANRVKGRFLANMSHELRTPLNGVIGLASLLERTPLDLTQQRYLENLRSSGQHLLALVSDVLDFEKIAAGNLELDPAPIEPAAFLESLLQAVRPDAEAKGLELRGQGFAGLPARVALDARRLRQVLLNLLANAVKFTPAGSVTLAASADCPGEKAAGSPLRFSFSVADTGIGIPPERLDRLFKPFSQVDSSTTRIYGGTGLGLAICKALVERMGGAIEVETAPGEGSTFRFTCLAEPAEEGGAAGGGEAAGGQRPAGRSQVRRVLLAEDQPINQIVAVAMLEELGCQVTLAVDGRQAVEKAGAESFDLIVLDLQMPELDGLEAAGRIRRLEPAAKTPIVLLTADVRPEVRERSDQQGIDDFLAKPVQLEDFAELLRRLEK